MSKLLLCVYAYYTCISVCVCVCVYVCVCVCERRERRDELLSCVRDESVIVVRESIIVRDMNELLLCVLHE